MTEKRYEPGKKASFRPTKDLPRYFYDYLNDNEVGNRELLELLLLGIQTKMERENKGIFLPFFDLPSERREEIAANDELLRSVIKVAEWLIFDQGGPPKATFQEVAEDKKVDPEPEPMAKGDIDVSEDGAINRFLQQFEDDDEED